MKLFCCGSFLGSGLLGGSLGCSLGGFLSGLGGSDFSFLLCYFLSFGGVLGFLFLETCFRCFFTLAGHCSLAIVNSFLFFSLPGVETALSLGFVESAFLHTTLKVFHQQYPLLGEDRAYGVGGLSTNVNPIQSPFEIQRDCSRISVRIIGTNPFNETTISW